MLRLVILYDVSIGNAVGLLHAFGKVPAKDATPDEREGPRAKESNTGKEPLSPQHGGKVPDKLDRSKVRLVSAGKDPGSAQDSGNVPARGSVSVGIV